MIFVFELYILDAKNCFFQKMQWVKVEVNLDFFFDFQICTCCIFTTRMKNSL